MKTQTMKGFPTGGGGKAEPQHYLGTILVKPLCTKFTKHTKNLKAFLTTKVFLKLKNANENEQLCHPKLGSGSLKETEILNINKSCKTEQSTFQNDNAKAAFTLAEVLITLGIIGIVAAMTLPALVQNYKKKEAITRLKKFYSTMSQAIMLSENDNGPSIDWEKTYYGDIKDEDGNVSIEGNRNATIVYFNKYIKPYIKYVKVDENPVELQDGETVQTDSIVVYLSDGSVIVIRNGACTDFHFDVNGNKPPNEYGKDKFAFALCPRNKAENECGGSKNWCAYCPTSICNTREKALQTCKTQPVSCGRVLMMDGWEFKEDYPYKL